MLHLNEQRAKSAGRLLQILQILEVESPALDQTVFGRIPPLPLPALNEVDFKKVDEKQSKLKEYWRRNTVLSFWATSSSAEK